jgi:hypothetical protein
MKSKTKIFVVLAVLVVMAMICVLLLEKRTASIEHAWFKSAPIEDNEVFEQVLEHRNRKDFDRAVAVALKGVNGKTPDDFLLQTVADTYFERAEADTAKREQWTSLAVQYSEQALQTNPNDLVNVFNVGESYLSAGMSLPNTEGCMYFKKSLDVFEQLKANSILQQKSGVIEGKDVYMMPYRQRLDEKIKQVRMSRAGCSY